MTTNHDNAVYAVCQSILLRSNKSRQMGYSLAVDSLLHLVSRRPATRREPRAGCALSEGLHQPPCHCARWLLCRWARSMLTLSLTRDEPVSSRLTRRASP